MYSLGFTPCVRNRPSGVAVVCPVGCQIGCTPVRFAELDCPAQIELGPPPEPPGFNCLAWTNNPDYLDYNTVAWRVGTPGVLIEASRDTKTSATARFSLTAARYLVGHAVVAIFGKLPRDDEVRPSGRETPAHN